MFRQENPIFVFRGPFGIPVEIGGSILFLAMLFIGFGATNPDLLLQGVILFAMVVVSIFLHELGHAWGARVQGVPVQKIVLYGGGGYCQHASTSAYVAELIVAMGPIVNLVLWAVSSLGAWWIVESFAAVQAVTPELVASMDAWFAIYGYLNMFAWINLVLFVLNMVPVQPLDGGKLLHLGLLRLLPQITALRIAGAIGLVFAILWLPAMLLMYFQFGWLLLFVPQIAVHWQMAKGIVPV